MTLQKTVRWNLTHSKLTRCVAAADTGGCLAICAWSFSRKVCSSSHETSASRCCTAYTDRQLVNYTVSTKKRNPETMYDRNVKSEHILTKLHVLDYEYICDRIAKFHRKMLFITRVINIQILATKYLSFQYSVTYCHQPPSQAEVKLCWRNEHTQMT